MTPSLKLPVSIVHCHPFQAKLINPWSRNLYTMALSHHRVTEIRSYLEHHGCFLVRCPIPTAQKYPTAYITFVTFALR